MEQYFREKFCSIVFDEKYSKSFIENKNITMKFIQNNYEMTGDMWWTVSGNISFFDYLKHKKKLKPSVFSNENIPVDYMLKEAEEKGGEVDYFSYRKDLTLEHVEKFIKDKNFSLHIIMRYLKLPLEIIKQQFENLDEYFKWNGEYCTIEQVLEYKRSGGTGSLGKISSSPHITEQDVLNHPEIEWDSWNLGRNPNISLEFFKNRFGNHMGYQVEGRTLDVHIQRNMEIKYSYNPKITFEDYKRMKAVSLYDLSRNPGVTLSIVEDIGFYKEKGWSFKNLYKNIGFDNIFRKKWLREYIAIKTIENFWISRKRF